MEKNRNKMTLATIILAIILIGINAICKDVIVAVVSVVAVELTRRLINKTLGVADWADIKAHAKEDMALVYIYLLLLIVPIIVLYGYNLGIHRIYPVVFATYYIICDIYYRLKYKRKSVKS